MTEREWRQSTNPTKLWYDRRARNHRKRRLVAYACARRVLSVVNNDPRAVALIEACERYTDGSDEDGPANWKAILVARRPFRVLYDRRDPKPHDDTRRRYALNAIYAVSSGDACGASTVLVWGQEALRGRRLTPRVTERAA